MRLLDTALASGIRGTPLRDQPPESAFLGREHQKRFVSGCHRGYDRAQDTLLDVLLALRETTYLDGSEIEFRESVFRRIADSIAVAMLSMKDHVMARMCLEYAMRPLDLQVLVAAYEDVKRMNAESRMTFALLADMTTFVHVCDVLRIDFRPGHPLVQMIELKGGRVNEILLEELENYQPVPQSLELVESDSSIAEHHKAQAKRILRQAIRRDQVQQILRTDEGTDPISGQHMKLSKVEVTPEGYGEKIEEACEVARQAGSASITIDECLHVGVGYASEHNVALRFADSALDQIIAAHFEHCAAGLIRVLDEVRESVPDEELILVMDPLWMNLHAIPTRPFPTWGLKKESIQCLLERRLVLAFGFDIASFIWMCREIGIKVRLSTKKEAAERDQVLGGKGSMKWGHRIIAYESCDGPVLVGERNLLRFLCDWISPADFVSKTWLPHMTTPMH